MLSPETPAKRGGQKPKQKRTGADAGVPMVDGGETMGGLKAKLFPELASDPAAMLWVEIGPAKVLARRKGRMCPRVV